MTDNIGEWTNQIHTGDAIDTLTEMPESSVHMCMTSPPYFGLRDYGEEVESVFGGDENCEHKWESRVKPPQGGKNTDDNRPNVGANENTQDSRIRGGDGVESGKCVKCGAWKGQLGLEAELDQFVENLVEVGREIRRVIRNDGSWWLNLGDSFAGSGRGQWSGEDDQQKEVYTTDIKRKSKMLVPHRVAIALQEDGWIIRNDVTWKKPNPMPSSVKDRLNTTTEQIFHLVPEPYYWYNLDAIREPHKESSIERSKHEYNPVRSEKAITVGHPPETFEPDQFCHENGKNPGDVFEIPTHPFPEAHFAVYPPELCEKPIKATAPLVVCADCGTPYEKEDSQWKTECECETDETQSGIVLDPFAGAGTTALVAKRLGRRFIGVDLNPEYVALAQKRIGIDVENPDMLLDEGETSLRSFAGGSEENGDCENGC